MFLLFLKKKYSGFILANCGFLPHSLPHQWLSGNAQNWKTGGAKFKPWSRLSTQAFGVFLVFSETRVNTGQDPLERPSRWACSLQAQVLQADNWPSTYSQTAVKYTFIRKCIKYNTIKNNSLFKVLTVCYALVTTAHNVSMHVCATFNMKTIIL